MQPVQNKEIYIFFSEDKSNGNLFYNMAFDEAMLLSGAFAKKNDAHGFIRFYTWNSPCISFGYAQPFERVLKEHPGLPLVRRSSGGGVVFHGKDFTYSIVIFPSSRLFHKSREELYLLWHNCIADALKTFNINCEIRKIKESLSGFYRCFENPVSGDLVLPDGRKIAGAAQRHSKEGIMVQGSIDIDTIKVNRERFAASFLQSLGKIAEIYTKSLSPDEDFTKLASHLAEKKYSSEKWNKERKI